MGRIRVFFDRFEGTTVRSAIAFDPQSTVGDIINQGFYKLTYCLPDGCMPIMQIHDEIVFEVDENKILECASIIKKECEPPLLYPNVDAPLIIPIEMNSGPNWFDQTLVEI